MTPDWLKKKGPDITKPVPVGEPMKDLRAPLPDPDRKKRDAYRWNWYHKRDRWSRWLKKERYA